MFLVAISAAVMAAALPAHAGGLPLERGSYVDANTPCRDAPTSARSWYGGSGYVIQAPHAHCEAVHVRRRSSSVFEVMETCRDESMPHSDYRITERIKVIDPMEYLVRNNFGRFHARLCR
jgi:hypothetical protein